MEAVTEKVTSVVSEAVDKSKKIDISLFRAVSGLGVYIVLALFLAWYSDRSLATTVLYSILFLILSGEFFGIMLGTNTSLFSYLSRK